MHIRIGLPVIDDGIVDRNLFAGDVIVIKGQSGSGKSSVALAFLMSTDLQQSKEASDSAF